MFIWLPHQSTKEVKDKERPNCAKPQPDCWFYINSKRWSFVFEADCFW